MLSRVPSQYRSAGGVLAQAFAKVRQAIDSFRYRNHFLLPERAVFGRWLGPAIRPLASQKLGAHMAAIESQFDLAFYLRQYDGKPFRRMRAEQAPLLHYALVGWREGKSPAPKFDPDFYRRTNPDVGISQDPLLHYVKVGAERAAACNEFEQRPCEQPWRSDLGAVLTIHHGRGGGSSRFLDLFEQDIRRTGNNVLRLRAVTGAPTLAAVEDGWATGGGQRRTEAFDLALERRSLVEFARRRGVVRLLVNHLIDRPLVAMDWVRDVSAKLGCPYDVLLHDYYALCPRVDLVMGDGRFCDVAPPEVCVGCIADYGSEVGDVDPRFWRRDFVAFLEQADRIIVPSDDMAARMRSHLAKSVHVWRPEDDTDLPSERRPCLTAAEPLRVAMLGALNVSKGVRVVHALARAAKSRRAPLSFTVLGPSSEPALLSKVGVTVTGPYLADALDRLIDSAAPHVVFLPAIWPETWSFVLTSALRRGLPVVAFDVGAPVDRLRRLGRGHILPLELSTRPDSLLAFFQSLRQKWIVE